MSKFPIRGNSIPPMLARREDFDRIWRALTKQSPDNLTIVGPTHIGKTVLLNHLAERVRESGTSFRFVVHWQMGHEPPKTNEQFYARLCQKLLAAISGNAEAKAECADFLKNGDYGNLRDVMEHLGGSMPVLMLWDMLDSPLSQPGITADLWSQVRSLFYGTPHRVVTSSRKPPSELVRDVATEESPFWNIFDPKPVRLLPFREEDREEILGSIDSHQFSKGARTELMNYTGGIPVLFLGMLNQLLSVSSGGEITEHHVRDAEDATLEAVGGLQKDIWRSCGESTKQQYHELCAEEKGIDKGSVSIVDHNELIQNGFAVPQGNKLLAGCRLLKARVGECASNALALNRLFKAPENFNENIKGLLEHRWELIPDQLDPVKKFLRRAVDDLPDNPEVCFTAIRGAIDAALDLIWKKELPGISRAIPTDWMTEWQRNGEKGLDLFGRGFPAKRGHQVRLLQLMTGTMDSQPRSKSVSKGTHALIEAAHGFGDFGQHQDGKDVTVSLSASALLVCIEMAIRLAKELR